MQETNVFCFCGSPFIDHYIFTSWKKIPYHQLIWILKTFLIKRFKICSHNFKEGHAVWLWVSLWTQSGSNFKPFSQLYKPYLQRRTNFGYKSICNNPYPYPHPWKMKFNFLTYFVFNLRYESDLDLILTNDLKQKIYLIDY